MIVTPVLDPISKPSVLWPRPPESPAESSIVTSEIVSPLALSIEKTWTGVLRMFRPEMDDVPVKSLAEKNLGLVFPPLLPSPSHHFAPLPSRTCPEAPVTTMFSPEIENRGPDHSSYPQVVVPWKMTYVQMSVERRILINALTLVPDVRPVMSSVVPEGTAILSKTTVAHDVFDLLAATASVKVQDARFSIATAFLISGAAVGMGTAATRKEAVLRPSPRAFKIWTILVAKKLLKW